MRLLVGKETPRQIVDIGSGTGDLAAMLRGVYPDAELLGLELSLAGIESAERKVPNAVFLQKDHLTLAEPPPPKYAGWATHAVCSEVLEHVDDPRQLLEVSRADLGEIYRALSRSRRACSV